MHLSYDFVAPDQIAVWVLTRQTRRIELHVRELDSGAVLICLAGEGDTPSRQRTQGPFPSMDAARGARRAVAGALQTESFIYQEAAPLWSLAAQRAVQALRARPPTPATFKTEDVFLDW